MHPTETNMSFLDPISGAWASISGTASVIGDPAIVKKYYSPALKAWLGDMGDGVHDGGPSDPRIGVIKLEAKLATHVVAHKGVIGRAYETVKGAVQGSVPHVNGIREFSLKELAECKFFSIFLVFWICATEILICLFRAPDASGISIQYFLTATRNKSIPFF